MRAKILDALLHFSVYFCTVVDAPVHFSGNGRAFRSYFELLITLTFNTKTMNRPCKASWPPSPHVHPDSLVNAVDSNTIVGIIR